MKTKTIKLTSGWASAQSRDGKPHSYRVEQVTNSTEFDPGAMLTKAQVDELCAANDWNVTIVPHNNGGRR